MRVWSVIGKLAVGMILGATLLATNAPADDPKPSDQQEIRIGAWNIEWLGFPDRRGRPGKDNPQTSEDLADYIHSTGVDVLALEEIGVDQATEPWTSRELDSLQQVLKDRHQEPWEFVLFPKKEYADEMEDFIQRGQHLALAWRSDKATRVGDPFDVPIGDDPEFGVKFFERRANAVKLSFGEGKTDAVFIPIHLKSNRNDVQPNDPTYTMRQRNAELKAFVRFLPALREHFKDEDIVILGDSNILDGQPTSKMLTDAGFVDLNSAEEGTTAVWGDGSTGYKTAPFDRIYVPAQQPEFRALDLTVHRTAGGTDDEIKEFRRKLSDHYLVSSLILIGQDDD